jgi:hypothetical protein
MDNIIPIGILNIYKYIESKNECDIEPQEESICARCYDSRGKILVFQINKVRSILFLN